MSIINKIFGDANEKYIKKLQPIIEKINSFELEFEKFSNEKLKEKTAELRERLSKGETLDDILPEAFAQVREASKRTLRQRHFDVQLIGGVVLHQGKIAEMKTGEGKTLAATLPLYLNALEGKGCHLVTVNDYLARRDTVWMGQIYNALGLSVGCINNQQSFLYDPDFKKPPQEEEKMRDELGGFYIVEDFLRPCSRREAYLADITYGTNNEFGFDYLRDNMVYDLSQQAQSRPEGTPPQTGRASPADGSLASPKEAGAAPSMGEPRSSKDERGFNYAIVDEVDSILIDEARTPLIISQPDAESSKMYGEFARITPRLKENEDFNIDEKMRVVTLTEEGINKIEKILGVGNIYEEKGMRYLRHLEEALKADFLFKRDKDYVVKPARNASHSDAGGDGQVIIVDEFTGRLLPGRRYSGGLHQAIEAKEGVRVQPESLTLATITFQNYFRLYKKLAGMTGTAATSAEEFHKVYNLDVAIVPTNKPMIRTDAPDKVYKSEKGKFEALIKEIKERYIRGQPVLIGTVSIEKNEYLGQLLTREGISHQILNAKNHEKEGEIIAQAGKLGTVTVATNMAGRGVDIILGGNPPNPEEAKKVKELDGLHVIGTERHEARRIDNQLRGRAGRQGDPGSSQFFVSLEDDLLRIFGGDRLKSLMEKLGVPEDQPIENRFVSNAIESAQSKIEGFNFDLRKHILEYDDVMNKHRETIYKKRKEIIEVKNYKPKILEVLEKEIRKIVEFHTGKTEQWNAEEIFEEIQIILPARIGYAEGVAGGPLATEVHSKLKEFSSSAKSYGGSTVASGGGGQNPDEMINYFLDLAKTAYETKEKEAGSENMRQIEKFISLRAIDTIWLEHLENMEYLRDSVRLRAYGQQDPLIEYKNEGHKMFKQLLETVDSTISHTIFKVTLQQKPVVQAQQTNQRFKKVGRNDPCPCGSGKKYKKCCGRNI